MAKNNETLIDQLTIYSSNERVAGIIDNKIEEAFLEYSWFINPEKRIIDTDAVNFVLKMKEENVEFFTSEFRIEAGEIGMFTRHSKETLLLLVNDTEQDISSTQISKADTITFNLLKDNQPIGEIYLVKK